MKFLLSILLVCSLSSFGDPQVDYRKVFGADYTWAVNWLKQNDQLIAIYAGKYKIPPRELKSIVFPELIRYNRVFDALEIESLKFLYVSEGADYANFSVGFFQMKPSFAEMVETDADKIFGYTGVGGEDERRARVRRLTSVAHQLNYLCAFYRICETRFPESRFMPATERVRLFATAYNSGYRLSIEQLRAMQKKNHFNSYNYSDISAFYFTQH